MFVRSAGERDLAAVRELLVETWHATYDPIYGAERVTAITDRLAFDALAAGPAGAATFGIPGRR